jgi:hypothetical protein
MKSYALYILRWVICAIPGAFFLNLVKNWLSQLKFSQDLEIYAAMVLSQAALGAVIFFIDRKILSK